MAYGDKRDYPKIDIYIRRSNGYEYLTTTTWSKTCKDAIKQLASRGQYTEDQLKANFRK